MTRFAKPVVELGCVFVLVVLLGWWAMPICAVLGFVGGMWEHAFRQREEEP